MGPHDEFLELCAVSTSGDLTEAEKTKLEEHVANCPECRQALKEFQAAAEISAPLFAAEASGEIPPKIETWSVDAAQAKLAHDSEQSSKYSTRLILSLILVVLVVVAAITVAVMF